MKNFCVDNEKMIKCNDIVKLHLTYNNDLKLRDLSEILNLINMSINDVNRERGITNNFVLGNEYATKIASVESGSIILNVAISVVSGITINLLSNYIYDRLTKRDEKANKKTNGCKYPIVVNVNGDNNSVIIHINN